MRSLRTCALTTWTSTRTSPSSWARGVAREPVRLVAKAAKALDRYVVARAKHNASGEAWLWIGQRGRLTDTGVEQVIKRRGREAGLTGIHQHLFRHTYAHEMLSSGMQEADVMRLAGWKSRQMLSRYGASAADDRARAAYQTLSPGDKL